MKAEISLMDLTIENIDQVLSNTKRSIHWIENGNVGVISMMLNPSYFFFQLLNQSKMVGISWVYDIDVKSKSAMVGVLVWERISNFKEILDIGCKLFRLKVIYAIIDKPTNLLAQRLLKQLGFTPDKEVYNGWKKQV